jgi:Fur family ferric uptake transcriptional regulator
VLFEANAPFSHAELVAALRDSPFDRATLFRCLNDFSEAGLVEKKDLGDRTYRFELKSDTSRDKSGMHRKEHPHFTCTTCGDIRCLPEATIGIRAGARVPKSVMKKSVQVTLQGLCDSCE